MILLQRGKLHEAFLDLRQAPADSQAATIELLGNGTPANDDRTIFWGGLHLTCSYQQFMALLASCLMFGRVPTQQLENLIAQCRERTNRPQRGGAGQEPTLCWIRSGGQDLALDRGTAQDLRAYLDLMLGSPNRQADRPVWTPPNWQGMGPNAAQASQARETQPA